MIYFFKLVYAKLIMKPDFSKGNGLLPAIIQDTKTNKVLMLGFMNEEALELTKQTNKVTFFSRTKNRLWTKGETSGNFLIVNEIILDCDADSFLIKATPQGHTCHTGQDTCFNEKNDTDFLPVLRSIIKERKLKPRENSYTNHLLNLGINKISQKVGEEAVEVVIDSVAGNTERLKEETADLLFHLFVLLENHNIDFADIENILKNRHYKN